MDILNAHRPMRRADRQVKANEELRAIVQDCRTVRLALVDEEGPFIVPLSFGYDWADQQTESNPSSKPRLTLWVHSATEGRKIDALNKQAHIAIEMDIEEGLISGPKACSYSCAFRSIMGTGTVHQVHDAATKRHGLTRIMQHFAPDAPTEYGAKILEQTNVYRIDVNTFTGKQR